MIIRARHGRCKTTEYNSWSGMIQRCCNPKNPGYGFYGARGIVVCDRWRASFVLFWSDVGSRPSSAHTLDRIDNDGNYEPGNCRWATKTEQLNNRRSNRHISHGGLTLTRSEWARRLLVSPSTLQARTNRGWTDEQTVEGRRR